MFVVGLFATLFEVFECADAPEMIASEIETKCTDLVVWVPLSPIIRGVHSPYDNDYIIHILAFFLGLIRLLHDIFFPLLQLLLILVVCMKVYELFLCCLTRLLMLFSKMVKVTFDGVSNLLRKMVSWFKLSLYCWTRLLMLLSKMIKLIFDGVSNLQRKMMNWYKLSLCGLTRLLMLFSKMVRVSFDGVSNLLIRKIMNWFNLDLAPLRATVRLLLNGQANALDIITRTSPSVVEKFHLFMKNRLPPAETRPSAPFEAGPPEPRSEPDRLQPPQPHANVTPSDETPHSSTVITPAPEPIDEHQLPGTAVVEIAGAEQDETLEPMSKKRSRDYKWNFDHYTETLTKRMSFTVNIKHLPRGFNGAVNFVRSNKENIEQLATGLRYVTNTTKLVKRSIKELFSKTGDQENTELLNMKRSLDIAETRFVKACGLKALTKNMEFIDARHADGSFEQPTASKTHGKLVFKTQRQIAQLFKDKQAFMEEFLRETRCLCDIYNAERERILNSARDAV